MTKYHNITVLQVLLPGTLWEWKDDLGTG